MILPSMISTGVIGMAKRLSMVPRSISRVTESALEIRWNFDCEQHRAGSEQVIELGLVLDDMGDVEICGVLNRLEDRAAKICLLLQQHRGRQVPRIGVDGVAEQQQLNERDHD